MHAYTSVPICEYAYNSMEMGVRGQCAEFIQIKDLEELLVTLLPSIYQEKHKFSTFKTLLSFQITLIGHLMLRFFLMKNVLVRREAQFSVFLNFFKV